jgi:glycosyltransferase involved in cell wall biosynthesis
LKILNVIAAYKPAVIYGGPTMSVAMLCEELSKAGISTEVFTTTANGARELPVIVNKPAMVDGVTVTYFKRITKDHTHFSPGLIKALWKRAKEFDVLHIHAWWNLVSVLSCMVAMIKGIPVILSPRGTLSDYSFSNKNIGKKKLIHNLLGKKLLAKCHIHSTAQRESVSILNLIKPVSITTIPNFVKLEAGAVKEKPIASNYLKLLFFSRIEEKKGLDILLNSLRSVTVPFCLTIAGDGDKNYIDHLKASITDPIIMDKITWAGFYNDDKFDLLRRHHLLVLPSHDENFGNVVIESLSVGTPVLISENVGLADYVKQNNLGWICETNAGSVSEAINNINNNHHNDMINIRENAPDVIRKNFSGDKLVQQYIHLYQNIIGHE